jgi:hypothetical protein
MILAIKKPDKALKSFIKKIKDMKEEEFSIGNDVNCE